MATANGNEHTPLLQHAVDKRLGNLGQRDEEASSVVTSHVTLEERKVGESAVGERLPYNDYTTIDWLHDLVKDSYRMRFINSRKGLRFKIVRLFDDASGWIAAAIIGALTACVAFVVDVTEATVSDYKMGYCKRNILLSREECCAQTPPSMTLVHTLTEPSPEDCDGFAKWSTDYYPAFGIYVCFALAMGIVSASFTMLTKRSLPAASPGTGDKHQHNHQSKPENTGKSIYMAAGSGIPEIKTILSGFIIPHFLDLKVLVVKGIGAVFAVATGMCLGKEGPFVHISACVGFLVAQHFPKYRDNGRKLREILSAACASGLTVAFGAPIGGVLFSYEEISTYFPRKVLWRSFLCSLVAAVVLKALNPNGTGRLVLFETHYGTSYNALHYFIFVLLGIAGGIFGGLFCKLNFAWSKWFRAFPVIKNNPVLEVFLVVLVTALLQYPNPLIREPGDIVIGRLLVDCRDDSSTQTWICRSEANPGGNWKYVGFLIYGTVTKLVLTIITFGIKVPSGVIIPALDAGALFGRLIGQWIGSASPGMFAMVGAAAFLAGVSRMTISLAVIMFELTGELEYLVPHMVAILVAKWVADSIGREGVYDLAQTVLGHPFLDIDHSMQMVQREDALVEDLIPPAQTMDEITVHVPSSNKVPQDLLSRKLEQLRKRGLMDAGLVLVQNETILGYLAEAELEFGLEKLAPIYPHESEVLLFGDAGEGDFDMTQFVDQTPLTVCDKAPLEYAVEMFGKLGLRYLIVTQQGSGKLMGVVIKKRIVAHLDSLTH